MKNRPLCVMVLFFCCGILILHENPQISVLWLAIFTAGAVASCMFVQFLLKHIKKTNFSGIFILCCGISFVAGGYITDCKNIFLDEMLPADGQEIIVSGIVENYEQKENSLAVYLKNCVYLDNENSVTEIGHVSKAAKIRNIYKNIRCVVYIKESVSVKCGSKITVSGKVNRWKEPTNEGQFDEKTYYYGMDIHFGMFCESVTDEGREYNVFLQAVRNLREKLHNNIAKISDKKSAGIFQAMLLGEKKSVDEQTKELFMEGSIGHILVVSGLHFSIAGLAVFHILRKFMGYLPSGIISGVLLFLLGILSGFSTSAIRAFVMFIIFILAEIWGRYYDLPTALSVAVFVILCRNCYTLFLPGFVLSVTAVLGIIVVVPVFEKCFKTKSKLLSGMYSSLGIQLFTLPVSLYYYFNFNPYSLILNAVVLPFMPFVLICGLISCVVSIISLGFAKIIVFPGSIILKGINCFCLIMKNLPFYNIFPGKPEVFMCVIYYVLLFCLVFMLGRSCGGKEEKIKKSRCLLFVPIVLIFFLHKKVPLSVTMLDVGQGQCIYVETKEGVKLMYDGGSSDIKEVGKYRIVPFLKAKGSIVLDGVFVSHLDSDHVSGIIEMLSGDDVEIKNLFLPDTSLTDEAYSEIIRLAQENDVQVSVFGKGSVLNSGSLNLEGLHPDKTFVTEDRNDTSIVIKLSFADKENNFSLLFCGDMEEKAQSVLLENNCFSDVDVLQVAHHGSGYTTSEEFLHIVQPEVSLISCGKDNSYGHPHEELLNRLEAVSSRKYITMECGAVQINVEKGKIKISTYHQ